MYFRFVGVRVQQYPTHAIAVYTNHSPLSLPLTHTSTHSVGMPELSSELFTVETNSGWDGGPSRAQ